MMFTAHFQKLQLPRFTQLSVSIFLLFFLFQKIHAQPLVEWTEGLGGSLNDLPEIVYATSDGNFIIAGQSASSNGSLVNNNGGTDLWVTKLDENGNLIWEKNYGGSENDFAMDLQPTADGGFIMTGGSASTNGDLTSNNGRLDLWVLKMNASGELQWSKNYGGSGVDIGSSIQPISGGYILAGCTGSAGESGVSAGFGGNEFWVLQLDLNGDLIWEKTFGGNKYDEAFSVKPTTDGGYIVGGSVQSDLDDFSNNAGNLDAWIIKTDAIGTTEWSELYGGAGNENLRSIAETTDGGYIMLAATNSYFIDTTFVSKGFFDWWIVKFGGNSINVNLGNDLTVCHDEIFTLDANVAGCNCTYLWNDGNTNATRNLSITSTTNYTVTVTNTDGLEGVDQITVFTSQPSVSISTTNIPCFGYQVGSITLTPNDPNYSYLWNMGSTNQEITNLNAGTYTYTVTDGNGCTIVDEAMISEPPAVTVLENIIEVDCNGNNTGSIDLNVSGGAGNFQYAWQSGETTQDIYNLSAGGYTVTITDMNGCINVQDWVINQPPTIDIGPNPFSTSCFDSEDGGAQMSINGGVGNFSYLWSNGSVNQNLSGVGVGTYTLTVTDGNFCQKIITVQVSSPAEIIIEETVQNADCFGNNSGSITTQISGGVGSYDFNWSNGSTTPNLSQLSSGTYTLTITDDNFCEKVKEIIVNQNTDINIFSQLEMLTCHDSNDGSIDLFPSGGTGDFTFLWNTGAETEDIDGLESGDYIITITDGNGCEAIQLFTIEGPDSISIMSTVFDIACFGEGDGMIQTEAFGGNGGYQYLWNNNENTSTIDDLTEGSYMLTVTDMNGCTQTETFNLNQPDQIFTSPSVTEVSCYGMSDGAIDLQVEGGNGGYIIAWSSGANSGLPSGDYTVTVTDMNNCEVIQDIFLPQPDSLIISIQALDPMNGNDGNIIATPTGGTSPYEFNWNDGMWDQAEISNLPAGIYDLIVTDANGCVENVSVLLEPTSIFEIENLQTFEIFPNPNDGAFFIKLEFEQIENFEISILNSLGQIIQRYNRTDNFILEKMHLENLTSGIYFVKIKTNNGIIVKKVIIQD